LESVEDEALVKVWSPVFVIDFDIDMHISLKHWIEDRALLGKVNEIPTCFVGFDEGRLALQENQLARVGLRVRLAEDGLGPRASATDRPVDFCHSLVLASLRRHPCHISRGMGIVPRVT